MLLRGKSSKNKTNPIDSNIFILKYSFFFLFCKKNILILTRLGKADLGAPCYYIISGVNDYEGAVIERDREGIHGFYRLDKDRWYIVQTNYDRDLPDPQSDYRRVPAEQKIDAIGQANFTDTALFNDVLALSPNLRDSTLLTVIISAETGEFNTTIWT